MPGGGFLQNLISSSPCSDRATAELDQPDAVATAPALAPCRPAPPACLRTPRPCCRGIVESSLGRGAIELGRARGFGEVGSSGLRIDASLPSFGSHVGGVILRAAINHYIGNIAELQ